MKIINDLHPQELPMPVVLAVGFFDGVHRGHQAVLKDALKLAKEVKAAPVVLTFYPHPMTVLAPDIPVPLLLSQEEKEKIIEDMGFHYMIVVRPSVDFLRKTADHFLADLGGLYHLKGIVTGENFTFGKGAAGNGFLLKKYFKTTSVQVHLISLKEEGGRIISSTGIRETILAGHMKKAARLLGRNYVIRGDIIHGFKRGMQLTGFPTANLRPERGRIIPKDGVYATRARIRGHSYPAVTNVGRNPTFGNENRSIETFIISFDENIYDAPFELEWIDRIRDEIKFDSVDLLKEQIKKDIETAKKLLR